MFSFRPRSPGAPDAAPQFLCTAGLVLLAVSALPAQVLLHDDFSSNTLDPSTWIVRTTGIPQGGADVRVENLKCILENRGHLVTRRTFDADRLDGYLVRCTWRWSDGLDRFQLQVRSDGIPAGNYGETQNAIELIAGMETVSNAALWVKGSAMTLGPVTETGGITFATNTTYTAELWDVGTHIGARILASNGQSWEFRAPVLSDTGGHRHICVHNREQTNGWHQCRIDDVTIERLAGWRQLASATTPPARFTGGFAPDPTGNGFVLFGGDVTTATMLDDTWRWNGLSWQQLAPSTQPSPRMSPLVFDSARQRLVLFGGEGPNLVKLGDTWEFDGSQWLQRQPMITPPPRAHHGFCYDSVRQRTVLFGGYGTSGERDDTWEWDGTQWTQVVTAGPSVRHGTAMAYDAARQRTVLFGGGSNGSVLDDTWEYDGQAWTQRSPLLAPPSRSQHDLVAAPWLGGVLLVGGQAQASPFDDSWLWDGTSWARLRTDLPVGRRTHRVASDPSRNTVVLFGGTDCGPCPPRDDLYESGPHRPASFGDGCAGWLPSAPTLAVVPGLAPRIGTQVQFTMCVQSAQFWLPLLALGVSDHLLAGSIPLPLDLTVLGWPGCSQLVSMDDVALMGRLLSQPHATHTLPIPNQPALVGFELFLQAGVLDSSWNLAMSNAVHLIVSP